MKLFLKLTPWLFGGIAVLLILTSILNYYEGQRSISICLLALPDSLSIPDDFSKDPEQVKFEGFLHYLETHQTEICLLNRTFGYLDRRVELKANSIYGVKPATPELERAKLKFEEKERRNEYEIQYKYNKMLNDSIIKLVRVYANTYADCANEEYLKEEN